MAGVAGRSGGTNRKPKHLKIVQGTYRKDRANHTEPEPELGIPEHPKGMTYKAKKYYHELAKIIEDMKVLTVADKFALKILAENFVDYDDARKSPEKSYTKIVNLRGQILIGLREFGLTPASRSRVSTRSPLGPKNEWGNL
jgi:phage terminase small subunit